MMRYLYNRVGGSLGNLRWSEFMRSLTYWPLWWPLDYFRAKFFTVKLLEKLSKTDGNNETAQIISSLFRENNSVNWHFGFRLCVWWIFELINFIYFGENAEISNEGVKRKKTLENETFQSVWAVLCCSSG